MAAKTIAIVNMKGGVGKTTVSVALAETFAAVFGFQTLVIDLDAQASCSFALLGESGFEEMRARERHTAAFFAAMTADAPFGDPGRFLTAPASRLAPTAPLALMGATPALHKLEREIIYALARAGRPRAAVETDTAAHLARALAFFGGETDVVLIDCPPGISAFTEAALRVCDLVIAPVTPDYLPALGLEAFLFQSIQPLRREGAFKGGVSVLINQMEASLDQERFIEQITGVATDMGSALSLFHTRLPRSRDIARAIQPPDFAMTYEEKYASAGPLMRELAQETLDALAPADA